MGAGIKGIIAGKHYKIGSPQYIGIALPEGSQLHNVFLTCDNKLMASFSLQDRLSEGVLEFTQFLSDYQSTMRKSASLSQIILSGDAENNVASVAQTLHINEWQSRCLPEDKLNYIKALQASGKRVLMIGDGINDGPVLAQADISIAVNKATDLAKNAADVLMLRDNINTLKVLFTLARKTRTTIRANILWALGYNTCALPLAVMGLLAPWMAVIGMSLSSIIVVFNSTRLLSVKHAAQPRQHNTINALTPKQL